MAPPGSPRRDDGSGEGIVDTRGGIDLIVVGAQLVDLVLLEVSASFTWSPITAKAFSTFELIAVAVHPDEEDVETGEEVIELEPPAAVLDDVVNEQVVPGGCHSGDAAVESVEEQGPQVLRPGEQAGLVATTR